jgi:gamma-glutamyl hydrolase
MLVLTPTAPAHTLLQVDDIMSHVNGLLMPGGVVDLTPGARYAIQRVKELNDAGIHFPLWGTCLGFEWIVMATAGTDDAIVDGFDSENINYPISYTAEASTSRFVHVAYL